MFSGPIRKVVPSHPITLLLVEDNPADVRFAQETLRDHRIQNEMHVVGDGEEALAFLRCVGPYVDAPTPDLILLDINLPRMDGLELLDELKKEPALSAIPIAILTTSKVEERILKTYNLPSACYLTKPLEIDKYLDAIRCFKQFGLAIVAIAGA